MWHPLIGSRVLDNFGEWFQETVSLYCRSVEVGTQETASLSSRNIQGGTEETASLSSRMVKVGSQATAYFPAEHSRVILKKRHP
jgi:hypothetical protein